MEEIKCDGSGNISKIVEPHYRIRKLTERECFRLMGVKGEDFDRVAQNQSTSSLYHLAGDSICCSVLVAIFAKMFGKDSTQAVNDYLKDIFGGENGREQTYNK